MLAIKTFRTNEEIYKAHFVVQKYYDAEKNMLVHNSLHFKQQDTNYYLDKQLYSGFKCGHSTYLRRTRRKLVSRRVKSTCNAKRVLH